MIAVTPTNLPGRILAALVARPGALDVEGLAQALFVPKLTDTRKYLEWRKAAIQANENRAEISNALHRLQQRGDILPLQPPMLGANFEAGEDLDLPELAGKLLNALVRKQPPTMRAWVGSAPSGNVQDAVRLLVDLGLVVPPSRRWPSPQGVALVASWAAREVA